MLSAGKLRKLCEQRGVSVRHLAAQIARAGLDEKRAVGAIGNWQKGLFKPRPSKDDITKLATALGVSENDISEWRSICRYAPGSPRKMHLVTQLIAGRPVQEAMDLLKFTHKRAASMVNKVLKSSIPAPKRTDDRMSRPRRVFFNPESMPSLFCAYEILQTVIKRQYDRQKG